MAKLEITEDKLRQLLEEKPQTREVIEILFPQMKEDPRDKEHFVSLGQILFRKGVSNKNVYFIQRDKDYNFGLFNAYDNRVWGSSFLKGTDREFLTRGEFKRLVINSGLGKYVLDIFVPIPTNLLVEYVEGKVVEA